MTEGNPRAEPPAVPLRPDTTDPRRSRLRALKVLFAADLRDEDPRVALDRVLADAEAMALLDEVDLEDLELDPDDREQAVALFERPGGPRRIDGYAQQLVAGVAEHRHDLDDRIRDHARGWRLERMPLVDRNVLRLAIYELLHEDVRAAIVIDEAVELVKELSSDEAPRFVNGVLEAVRRRAQESAAADDRAAPSDGPAVQSGDEAAQDAPVEAPAGLDGPGLG